MDSSYEDDLLQTEISCPSPDCDCERAYRGRHESRPYTKSRLDNNTDFTNMVFSIDHPIEGVAFSKGASAALVRNAQIRAEAGTVNQWLS